MAELDNESGDAYGVVRSSCSEFSGNREQDRYLPIANVSRIMKKALPANGKISKEAKETVQECVSEFISFITGEASDKCQKEKRKTVNGDDILWAMTTLGFDDYVEPLKVYLQRYREIEGERTTLTDHRQQGDQRDHDANGGESTSTGGLKGGFSGGYGRSTGSDGTGVYGQSGEQSTEMMMMMSHHAHGNHQRHMNGSGNGRTSSGRTRCRSFVQGL